MLASSVTLQLIHLNETTTYVIKGSSNSDYLNFLKQHKITNKKPQGVSKDEYLDRIFILQRHLTSLHACFPAAILLIEDELTEACLRTPPVIF